MRYASQDMFSRVKMYIKPTPIWALLRVVWRYVRGIPLRQYVRNQRATQMYRRILKPGDLAFDIGANMGLRTATMRSVGARVVSVEPQRHCAEALRNRFRNDRSVIVEPLALGKERGQLRLKTVPGMTTISTLSEKWPNMPHFSSYFKNFEEETVQVITLDELIQRYGVPAFCKIDVEGYEPEVLAGLSRPVPMISFEYYRPLLENVELCVMQLSRIGNPRFNYAIEESMRWVLPDWVDGSTLLSLLRSSSSSNVWGDVYVAFPRHDETDH